MSTGMSPQDKEALDEVFEFISAENLQQLREMKDLSTEQREAQIQSLPLGTRLSYEVLELISMENTGAPRLTVNLLPRLHAAIELLNSRRV